MGKAGKTVSDTELEVLKALWDDGGGNARHLQERLETRGRDWAYTTVQTLLGRLVDKGFATIRKDGRANFYEASVSRDQLLEQHLGDLANRVCEGATTPLVVSLFEDAKFTKDDISRFRTLLDELEKRK